MGVRSLLLILIATALALGGCNKAEPTPTAVANAGSGGEGTLAGGLADMNTLALGVLKLEGTAQAVTAAQAAELLPLWQMLQGGALQGAAETEAVTKQVRGAMTSEQLAAIEAMDLTMDDVAAWMQQQGIEMPRQDNPDGQGRQGGPGVLGDLSEEERATRRAERGIEIPGGGAPSDSRPSRAGGAYGKAAVDQLLDLLAQRAAQ